MYVYTVEYTVTLRLDPRLRPQNTEFRNNNEKDHSNSYGITDVPSVHVYIHSTDSAATVRTSGGSLR